MSDERQDFSSIDPRADARRWADMVEAVVRGAEQRRRPAVLAVIRSWAAPVLAMAAGVVFVSFGASALQRHLRPAAADPAYAVLISPEELAGVDTVTLLGMLEVSDAR